MRAKGAKKKLDLKIYTTFPALIELIGADIISWDNDLGGDVECVRLLRQYQYFNPEHLMLLNRKIHLIHSMNAPAVERLYSLLGGDLKLRTYIVPFTYMKLLSEQQQIGQLP